MLLRRLAALVVLLIIGFGVFWALKKEGTEAATPDVYFRVVDEQGGPVASFEARIDTADNLESTPWMPGNAGVFKLKLPFPHAPAFDILVRAEGYASLISQVAGAERDKLLRGAGQLVLEQGREVNLELAPPEGVDWPDDVMPLLYFDDMRDDVRSVWDARNRLSYNGRLPDFDMLRVSSSSPGRFKFRLADDTLPFYVGIHAPGFLRFFETGPFTEEDFKDDVLRIELPRPATVEIHWEASGAAREANSSEKFQLELGVFVPGTRDQIQHVASETAQSTESLLRQTDLAPGDYRALVRSEPMAKAIGDSPEPSPLRRFRVTKAITLSAGATERVDLEFTPFDSHVFRGDTAVTVRIRTSQRESTSRPNVSIYYEGGNHGRLLVHSGKLPASGELLLENLRPEQPNAHGTGLYLVEADGRRLGTFTVMPDKESQHFEFHLAPVPGDLAPQVKLQDLDRGASVDLRDFRGKVVVLEFWSADCGPCQRAMSHLNEMASDETHDWQDRVIFAALSIDATAEQASGHARRHGWNSLRHFWTGNEGELGWDSPAAKAFGLNSTPTTVLIDSEGRIVWRGHPDDVRDGGPLLSRLEAILD